MAFSVQTDDGAVVGALSYETVAGFKAYHAERGNAFSASDTAIEQALVKATDYLDFRFSFVGRKKNIPQATEWPRYEAYDKDDNLISGIPTVVKEVVAEYALRALTAPLAPDPTVDPSGQKIKKQLNRVEGAVTQEITYVDGGITELAAYPTADRRMVSSGLTRSNKVLSRG